MKKLVVTIVILVQVLAALALNYTSGSGEDVPLDCRTEQIHFHNFIHEYNWDGASNWAVKFDVADFYESPVTTYFNADGVDFFYSSTADAPITLTLYSDHFSQPDTLNILANCTFGADEITYGWNRWDFQETIIDTVFWLNMDFLTNGYDRYIPGSYGDGKHSYYKTGSSYVNMYTCGFPSEFLVNLTGEPVAPDMVNDVWITDFYLPDDQVDPFVFYPILKLSAMVVGEGENFADSILVNYQRLSPFRTFEVDTIFVDIINNGDEISIDFFDYDSLGLPIEGDFAEYTMKVTIYSNDDDFAVNNQAEINLDFLPRDASKILVENSVRLNHGNSNLMWQEQEDILSDFDSDVLNYFGNLTDSLYVPAGFNRILFYHFNFFPSCVVNGDRKLHDVGDIQVFRDSLQSYLENTPNRTPRLLTGYDVFAYVNQNDSVNVKLELSNTEANYFVSRLSNTKLFIAVGEENISTVPQMYGSTFVQMLFEISGSEFISLATASEDILKVHYDFFRYNVDSFSGNLDNHKLFIWLQNINTGEIHNFETIHFDDIIYEETAVGSEEIPGSTFHLKVYPNPFSSDKPLQVKMVGLERAPARSEMKIYNIKGQLVQTIKSENLRTDELFWNGRNSNNYPVASGVYLLKVSVDDGDKINYRTKKCLVLTK